MDFIINTILTGTGGITVALLVLQLFRLKLQIDPVIISSVSILLLLGSSIYLIKVPVNFAIHYHSGGEYQNYRFKKGNFWTYLMMGCSWLLVYGLLPQILWIKKLRRRLSSLLIIVGFWAITSLFVPWGVYQFFLNPPAGNFLDWNFKFEFSFVDYLEQGAAYAAAFAIVYSYLSRMSNDDEVVMEDHPIDQ